MNDANYIQGIFVVRQSVRQEPHRSLIDHDESSHRIILRGFQELHETTILVNGKHLQSKVIFHGGVAYTYTCYLIFFSHELYVKILHFLRRYCINLINNNLY